MYYEIFYHYVVVQLYDFRYVIGICKIFFFFFLFFWNEIMKLKRLMKYIHLWAYLWLYNLYEYELVKVISYNRYLCKVVMACLIFSHWFNEDTFSSGTSLKKQQKLGYEMCIFFLSFLASIYLCIVVALDIFSERTKIDFKIFS